MSITKRIPFLGTFDEGDGVTNPGIITTNGVPPTTTGGFQVTGVPGATPPVNPTPQPTNGEQPVIPASALPAILDAANQVNSAQQAVQQARAKQAEIQAAATATTPDEPPKRATNKEEISSLKEQLTQMQNMLQQSHLDTVRERVVNQYLGQGRGLIEAMIVGTTPAEIEASAAVAAAEYDLIYAKAAEDFKGKLEQPQATPQPQEPQPPQGTVSSVGGQPAAPPPAPAAAPNVPSFLSAPGIPDGQPNSLTAEQLNYLTSSEARRNGDYAKNRHLIHAAVRNMGGRPPREWTLAQHTPNLAPPVPAIAPPQQPAPAVGRNVYAGVEMPQVQAAPPIQGAPGTPPLRQPPARGPLVPTSGSPTPQSLEAGGALDVTAARRAAEAAVARGRGSSSF